jgi:hypothetical protein
MTAAAQPASQPPTLDVDLATTLLAERGLTLGGRNFVVATKPSVRQRAYMHKWRAASGVDEMMADFDPKQHDRVSAFVEGLIIQSFENDAIFHMLAGGLVPVTNGRPQKWDYRVAEQLAGFFGDLEEESDVDALNKAILGVLSTFFLLKIVSDAASLSSTELPEDQEAINPDTPNEAPAVAADESAQRRQSDAVGSPDNAPDLGNLGNPGTETTDDHVDPPAISETSTK